MIVNKHSERLFWWLAPGNIRAAIYVSHEASRAGVNSTEYPLPPSGLRRYVSSFVYYNIIRKFCGNLYSCIGSVQQTDEIRYYHSSLSLPATGLPFSRFRSCRPPSPSPGTRSIPKCRRQAYKVARSDCKCFVCALCDPRQQRRTGKSETSTHSTSSH